MTASRGRRKVTIQQRRGTPAEWAALNPILANGEIGVSGVAGAVDRIKVGDGVTPWNELPYMAAAPGYQDATTVQIADVGGLFDSGSVEGALAEAKTVADAALPAATAATSYQPLDADLTTLAGGAVPTNLRTILDGDYAPYAEALRYGTKVVLLGDSMFPSSDPDQEEVGRGSDDVSSSASWWLWAQNFMGHPFTTVYGRGVGGQRTDNMLARIEADVMDLDTEWVVVGGGANDLGQGVAAATIIANLTAIIERIVTDRRRIVLFTPWASNSYTAAGTLDDHEIVYRWVLETAPVLWPQVIPVDVWRVTVDPATGGPAAGVSYDGIHLSEAGGVLAGREFARVIGPLLKPRSLPLNYNSPVVANPGLLTNGSGWALTGNGGGTCTVAYAPADSGRRANKAVLTFAGHAGGNVEARIERVEPIASGLWAPGDIVQASARLKWSITARDTSVEMCRPWMRVYMRNLDGSFQTAGMAFFLASGQLEPNDATLGEGEVICKTNAVQFGPNSNNLYLSVGWIGCGTGVVEISDLAVRKIG